MPAKPVPSAEEMLAALHAQANPAAVAGMARFGVNPANTLGLSMPALRAMARGIHSHALALELWQSGLHEARILAALVEDPRQVTPQQMDAWVAELDSWDVCDQVCFGLFDRTPYADEKIHAWATREEEFVRRAAFATLAGLAIHAKNRPDADFEQFFPLILAAAADERNFVKKAVNWALRQIGKRSPQARQAAIACAGQILASAPNAAARWVARDALRELNSANLRNSNEAHAS